jgi:2-oxoisovalerate dehydrogenase E2 component (dihydrolipoyl transacylase)
MGEYIIKLPDVGEGIAEAEVVEWNVKVGDIVKEDQSLSAVMTDKATVEIPSPVDGKVLWLGAEIGDTMAVGAPLIRLEVEGEGNAAQIEAEQAIPSKEEAAPAAKAEAAPEPVPAPKPAPEPVKAAPVQATVSHAVPTATVGGHAGAPRAAGEKPIASPAVRKKAKDAGVDLKFVRGTGPAGRISHDDLDAYISGAAAPVATGGSGLVANTSVEEIKVVGLRRKIAGKMQDTKRRIPHFTYVDEVDVDELESLRANLNAERRDDQPKLTLLPFIMKALVVAMRDYPQMNARYDDENEVFYQYGGAHLGIAAQTDKGLIVPVVTHAEARDIWDCAREVKRLSDAARNGTAKREELTGSTITITSLGPIGGIVTTPVINHPEVAILGINKIAVRPVWKDGAFVPRKIMNLSGSFDHRMVDGWDAANFIQRIKSLLENPAKLFMAN